MSQCQKQDYYHFRILITSVVSVSISFRVFFLNLVLICNPGSFVFYYIKLLQKHSFNVVFVLGFFGGGFECKIKKNTISKIE